MGNVDEFSDDGEVRLRPGTRLGKYEIIRMLGAGGMGAVYEAAHVEIGKHVAIKVLGPAVAAIPGARARFLREAQLTTRVRHPNIVDITDMGNENGQTYLVMELLRGEDLAHRLARTGPLSTRELADIMLPVCAAVVAAHRAGITHRDLKPQNIFLATNQNSIQAKVLDFGISKGNDAGSAGALTGTGAMIGTPFYLAPEQILDNRSSGPASDQYALGVILYETLTGHRPFDAENLFVVFQAIVAGAPMRPRERRPEISPEMEEVVLRAMHLNPKLRFESAEQLGRALLRFASERERLIWEEAFSEPRAETRPFPPMTDATPPPRPAPTTPLASTPLSSSSRSPAMGLTTPLPPASFTAGGQDSWPNLTPARSQASVSGTRVMQTGMLPQAPGLPSMEITGFGVTPDLLHKSSRSRNVILAVVLAAGGIAAGLAFWLGGSSPSRGKVEPAGGSLSAAPDPLPQPVRRPPLEIESFRVSLTTEPDSATVELDGTVVGSGSIERKMLVDHVPHTLRVSADGFEPRTVEFTDSPPPNRIALVRHVAAPPVAEENSAPPPSTDPPPRHRRRSRSSRTMSSGTGRGSEGKQTAEPERDAPRGLNPNGAPIID
jgi:eukaryotic-like serine/threonine-protein kinase